MHSNRKRRNSGMRWCIIAVFMLTLPAVLSAQGRTPQQNAEYRLAQSYERMGMYENAARRYRKLFNSDPANPSYYNALKRTLERLNTYDELIEMIRTRLHVIDDAVVRADLGSALYRAGREKEAHKTWKEVLKKFGKTSGAYSLVASSMLRNGLFDDAVETYRLARKELKNRFLFAVELANAFAGRGNYLAATRELLLYLEQRPMQVSYVRARITSFLQEDETVLSVVEQKVNSQSAPRNELLQIYGECLIRTRHYAKALQVMEKIEDARAQQKKQTVGREFYTLAEKALQDEDYEVAEQAFSRILNKWPESRYATAARLGRIRAWIASGERERSLTELDLILAENKKNTLALEAAKLKGRLLLEQLDRPARAYEVYRELFRNFSSRTTRKFAAKMLGLSAMRSGMHEEAESWFRQAMAFLKDNEIAEKNTILFHLASLQLCRHEFSESLQLLDSIQSGEDKAAIMGSIVNEALERALLIEENLADSSSALAGYADYLCALEKDDREEAGKNLETWLQQYDGSALTPRVLLDLADLYHEKEACTEEKALLQRVVQEFADTIYADEALFRLANAYAATGQKELAAQAYEQLLVVYPNSTYLELARKKLRRLSQEIKP